MLYLETTYINLLLTLSFSCKLKAEIHFGFGSSKILLRLEILILFMDCYYWYMYLSQELWLCIIHSSYQLWCSFYVSWRWLLDTQDHINIMMILFQLHVHPNGAAPQLPLLELELWSWVFTLILFMRRDIDCIQYFSL